MPSQSLSLAQTQQLQMVLAPQLRQSLEMLQLPILQLQTMIQKELEQNPTIEETIDGKDHVEIEPDVAPDPEGNKELEFNKEFEVLAKLDEEWRDYFFQDIQYRPHSIENDEKRQFMLDSLPQQESLQEHLYNQLNLSGMAEEDRQIGELIVGSVNDDGYLTATMDELSASANFDTEHVEDVLAVIQEFHPTGIAARSVEECLLMQLNRLGQNDSLAADVVRNHLDQLGKRKHQDIARTLKVTLEDIVNAAKIIATLDPKPGRAYSPEVATYILAEIIVRKVDGEYTVILDNDQLPHVRISRHYRSLLNSDTTKPEVKSYIREKIRAGAFLIKSIHQRQQTIYKIASEIVKAQTAFLDHGVSHLRPLTMSKIAEIVGVHETTVSRAVSGKYMKTPSGIFELKYFFTPGIRTADGKQVSNMAVKEVIASLVADEDPEKPLSDQDILQLLSERGMKIARRTVAKYRLVLRIPPSHLRKEL